MSLYIDEAIQIYNYDSGAGKTSIFLEYLYMYNYIIRA